MKKLALAALLASSVLAISEANSAGYNGFYMGADIGASKQESNNGFSGDQANIGINLGFGGVFNNGFYLAGEVGVRNSGGEATKTTNITISGTTYAYKFASKTNTTKIISIIPGFVVNKSTLIYARLGRGNADYENTETIADVNYQSKTNGNYDFNIYGLGLNYLVTSNLSVVAEINRATVMDTNTDARATNLSAGVIYRF
jgi:opacity protein-like surface antigen